MRRWGPALLLVVLAGCGSDSEPQWVLTFEDAFDGPAGQLPDPAVWSFDVGGNGWGNNQLEYNSDRPENCALDGAGNLALVAREEEFGGNEYTSARIKTQDRFEQAYGRFEARILLPRGQGIWPAFWMLGDDFPEVGWPRCGEIDIMEYRGQQTSRVLGSLHGPGYSGGGAISGRFDLPPGIGFDFDFHVFGVEWTPDEIAWTIDGARYQSISRSEVERRGTWVFDHPFFLILNVAVGGNFVGPPDASTAFPQRMLVDWVRAYELVS